MDELLIIAAVSALVGSVVTLFWESAIKPRRERNAIASAIAGELLNNARQLRQHLAPASPPRKRSIRASRA